MGWSIIPTNHLKVAQKNKEFWELQEILGIRENSLKSQGFLRDFKEFQKKIKGFKWILRNVKEISGILINLKDSKDFEGI